MIDTVAYNLPVSMYRTGCGRTVIVRSQDPAEIVEALGTEDLDRVDYVQILSVRAELRPLMLWGHGIPLDLVVQSPEMDLPFLYQCSPLLTRHPVRVSVPVVSGFSKVVKLAVSLNFSVKLEVSQPDGALIEEMSRVVRTYLHQPTVSQPIEFFHSMFLALYRGEPGTLWAIQEEDPARSRFITDDGKEILSKRFAGTEGDIVLFPERFKAELLAAGGECSGCSFLEQCSGYFKWPEREYRCEGVKALFEILKDAAHQLKADLEAFEVLSGEEQS